nr:hypothetical protein [Tanacetum cinerariifolium]
IILSIEDKLNYLEQLISPTPVAPEGQQVAMTIIAAHTVWIKGSKEIAGLMLMTMDSEIQQNLENLGAYEMLQELKTLFSQQAEQELLQTMREVHSCMKEEGQSNYNMHSMGKTINELHAMLKLYEQTLPKNNAPALHAIHVGKVQKGNNKHKKPQSQLAARGQNQGKWKNKIGYAPKPKIPPPPKREDPAKDSVCHQCRDTGHWKRNCPQYLAEWLKNKKLSQGVSGLGIFTVELYTFPNKSWVYDTGCGTHIFSCLYDDGCVNRFVDNSIQVSRNSMVYFSVVSRDGIFEIDFSDSYTNVSSMYALSNKRSKSNLDSALLWYCRLGHISKKRIEKLQHDGLLNSTDLRAFEKCVPCMSGKMARKPYSHQVDRAKDLLGLIHTDV